MDSATGAAETMETARERITSLSSDSGSFAVACRETGVRPAPITDATFDSYANAESARAAASRYRAALRDIDPALQRFELDVCEAAGSDLSVSTVRESTNERRTNGLPRARQTATVAGDRSDEWMRVENGPVVHLQGPDSPLDDEVVARQLEAKLQR
jgi:hypothetical protein